MSTLLLYSDCVRCGGAGWCLFAVVIALPIVMVVVVVAAAVEVVSGRSCRHLFFIRDGVYGRSKSCACHTECNSDEWYGTLLPGKPRTL